MSPKKRVKKKGKKKVKSTWNVDKFVDDILRETKYLESEKNLESDENWRKFFEEEQIDEIKKEVEKLHEDFLRNSAQKQTKCLKEIEKLNTKESIGLEGIAKISDFFEKSMKELQRNFLEEREELLKDLLTILAIPDLSGSLEKDITKLREEIFIQNENHVVKLERKLSEIDEEKRISLENTKQEAEELKESFETAKSDLINSVEKSVERSEKLSYIAEREKKMIELKNIINSRREKDFLFIILKEHFKKTKEESDQKLTIRDKRSFLRSKLNSMNEMLAKESSHEKKNLENLTMISTEEITNMQKIFSIGQKITKLLENILKIDKDFARVSPEKSSLIARSSEIRADVISLRNSREDLMRENEKLCQCLKNYCNNKFIDN